MTYKPKKHKKTPSDVAVDNLYGQLASLRNEKFDSKVSVVDVYHQFKQGKFKNVVLPPFELTAEDEKKVKSEKFETMVLHIPEKLTLKEKIKVMSGIKTYKKKR